MPKTRFRRLGLFYIAALGGIALSIIISQLLIQTSISSQQDDARVINVAGRQRMLSQNISKLALKIEQHKGDSSTNFSELQHALDLWKQSHEGLQNGNPELGLSGNPSRVIRKMFDEVEPHYLSILQAAGNLFGNTDSLSIQSNVGIILRHEANFLEAMDRIVFQYDFEAREKVIDLRSKEIYLFVISILIIGLELLFIFTPLAKTIRATVQELTESEKASKNMTRELSKLYEELGKSYQDLEAVNAEPESPSLYASMDTSGQITHLSSQFLQVMEYEEEEPPQSLKELLERSDYRPDFIDGVLDLLKNGKNWSGELRLITEPGDFCWLETHLIPVTATQEIKLIARNTTHYKEAKLKSREINKERIEKSVKEQQYRSALILEGQEEERKRLSREMHDGVGQMLSAMKLLLESFNPSSTPMKMRLNDAKDLMKSIIQEVRRVSFNLTPSSLDDFGLVPAINKFCDEINAVTKPEVTFVNETRFINRLDSNIETNLYRIIQEAVNNAIKYAKASHITVTFSHTINNLNITVVDDGKGFDFSRVERSGHFEKAGHGIFNMKERTSYIGGSFQMETEVGKGTKITITLSLDKND
ncbi:type IV pili methyl-accepting chemotaxis transducer N-terminal domain-containing protein [Marinoscillum pacificum]|uniref:type IV pili methyl-accepting chemotaxis transducer N-terminal domain-containing protein n=1 Tax=Marinoscillum pacificum TaxID=392723 RepID=UPI0021586CFD|nr:type IV pili methyl-accepting chemotaxis transducer N-terminal domain-containing protein [Marinoscillum pacificum]